MIRTLDKSFRSTVRSYRNNLLRADYLRETGKWPSDDQVKFVYAKCVVVCEKYCNISKEKNLSKKQVIIYEQHLVVLFFLETVSQRKQVVTYFYIPVTIN